MRKHIEFSIVALLFGCLVAACSGGSGSSLPAAPHGGITPQKHQNVAFTISVPARTTKYVSASTQSVSIVETDGTASPSPAVVQNTTPGSPNCTTASGATTCTISVNANVGDDSFVVKTFDQADAAGNVLSSGTVSGTVQPGIANSFPLTLGGTVASFTLTAADAYPQVAGSTTISAQAKDAAGNTIIGPYDSPITLTTTGSASFGTTGSLSGSASAATVSLADSQTTSFPVTGTVNGKTASITLNPSSGIKYFYVGTDPNDVMGFHIMTGNDGKLYYTALGLTTCTNYCSSNSGVIGQFDPVTGKATEISLATEEPMAPFQTSDGALWVALDNVTGQNASTGSVARITGGFSASNMSTIPLPTASPFNGNSRPRSFTLGADGNLYLTGNTDNRIYQIPAGNPSTANISAIPLPTYTAPPNAAFPYNQPAFAEGIATGTDGKLYIANNSLYAPNVLQYDTTGATFTPFTPPGGQGPQPRYIVTGSDGNLYESYGGVCVTMPCRGGLNAMTTAGAFTPIPMPDGYADPDDLAVGNGFVAFVDLGQAGLGTYNIASNEVRDYPIEPINANGVQCCSVWSAPDGVTVAADGSLWYITYGKRSDGTDTPVLAVAHVIQTANWSVWPSQQLNLYGTGEANAQLVGIMESGDSAPFTPTSTNSNVAILEPIAGETHNFHLVGVGAGSCTVTITDKNGRTESIAVTVTSTSGTVQSRGRRTPTTSQQGRLF
jgi:streptogramin lyase